MTDPALDDAAFRRALGSFASGVTVVTTVADGVDHAMTASAFTSVSIDPPQVLVCVDRSARFHDAIVATGSWGVSILAEAGRPAATRLSHKGRDLATQWAGIGRHRGVTGAVLVDDALAWIEARTLAIHDGGDHTIVVGAVVSAAVAPSGDDPLLYYRSRYGTIMRSTTSEKTDRSETLDTGGHR